MANDQQDLIAAVGMDLDSWDDGMRQMLADERKIEQSLEGVVDSANDAEKALNSIDGAIDLDVDTGELEKAKRIVEDIDGMGGAIDLSVDESELDTVRRLIADIDSDAPTVNVEVDDSEVESAKDEVDDIDSATPTVDVDVDRDEVDEAQDALEQIRNMQAIQIAITVAGNALEFIQSLEDLPGIGSIVELDNAMASFEGRTGRSAAQLDTLVETLHGQGIVAGREQIGEIATQSVQLGIAWGDVDEATAATLNTIAVTGGDANTTLTTMNNLVQLGLVDSFEEASDLIVTGFQTGADRGGDFLDVLNEYGSTFASMGIDGPSALALINSGLAAGFGNADRVADSVREMGIRIGELDFDAIDQAMTAFENGEITVEELNATLGETGTALNELDLLDETQAFLSGELSGEEFFTAVVDGLDNVEDAAERAQLAVDIFGTQAEDIGAEAITNLTTEGFDDIEGRAAEAAQTMADTITGTIAEVQQLIDDLAVQFFNSDQLDLQGKLDDMKARVQTFIDEINSGATFGEALEISLGAPGLEATFHDLEAFLGDFLLALADIFADILSIIPGQEAAAASLRQTVADMAGGQLTFDLSVANNAEGVSSAIASAVARGVDSADISMSMNDAFVEAMSSGDLVAAQAIADYVTTTAGTGISQGLYDALTTQGSQAMYDAAPQLAEELGISLDDALRMINTGTFRDLPITPTIDIDTTSMQADIDAATADIRAQIDESLATGDVAGAAALAANIGSSLVDEFTRLVNEGNFELAAIIAAGSPESGLDISYAAEQAGMSDAQIAELESNAQQAVDSTSAAVSALTTNAETAATDTTTALAETGTAYSTFSGEASTALGEAGSAATNYDSTVATAMHNVQASIDGAAEHFQTLIAAAHDAQAAVDSAVVVDANGEVVGHASGTTPGNPASGTFMAGEEGMEIISTNTDLSVLNNATTESILAGLAAILSGGYAGGGSSVTINQTNTFNNSGGAAGIASLDNASRAIRGY